ncbi:hypothetical protein TcasGA2_TC014062 [Tribolium castaneum]|uniref:Uncharacterized protein n=1 Tax=Tribolium castaneum TaxID=7070 RepID=D6WJZ9_TRICA|nr:hypothetical protein TcasGA2_TC014062 [Tribolium castaneum]
MAVTGNRAPGGKKSIRCDNIREINNAMTVTNDTLMRRDGSTPFSCIYDSVRNFYGMRQTEGESQIQFRVYGEKLTEFDAATGTFVMPIGDERFHIDD